MIPAGWSSHVEDCFRTLKAREEENRKRFPGAIPMRLDLAVGEEVAALLQVAAFGTVPPAAECRRALRDLLIAIADARVEARRVLEGAGAP